MARDVDELNRKCVFDLPIGQSAFLFGPRKSGKTTFLKQKFPKSIYYDLLDTKIFFKLVQKPWELREEILALDKKYLNHPIIIDEIQKIPPLLDEVHWMIENAKLSFILCGSSARTLRKGGINLLGGRAWSYKFFPLCYPEINLKKEINLLKIFKHGLLPPHYLSDLPERSLESYIQDYLKEEVKAESLVRNLQSFIQFLDAVSLTHGELTNYTNISRDCGVDSKTVKEYYQILIDTLIGFYVEPFHKKGGRSQITAMPKFYLFDVGVANYLAGKTINELKGSEAGKAFEHYILMELRAYLSYEKPLSRYEINFWRTQKTSYEVDFIFTKHHQAEVAIEVKINKQVDKTDMKGLIAFKEENPSCKAILVCNVDKKRRVTIKEDIEIFIVPFQDFLKELWSGKIV